MEKIRINKYISDAGFCSRREADQLIIDERVTVNGILAVLGTQVGEGDKVRIDGEILHPVTIIPDKKIPNKKGKSARRSSADSSSRRRAEDSRKTFHRGTRGGERQKIDKKISGSRNRKS